MRKSKPCAAIIHTERLPFSEAELFQAYRLCFPIRFAKGLARDARDAVKEWHWSRVRARYAIAHGSTNTKEINYGVIFLPPGLPILLALLSPALRDRVQQHMGISPTVLRKLGASANPTFDELLLLARSDLQQARASGREPSWVLFDPSDISI
jgi:hypothetical protein